MLGNGRDRHIGQESGNCMKELVKTSRMGKRNGEQSRIKSLGKQIKYVRRLRGWDE